MTPIDDDDDALDTLLAAAGEPLPDDGFSAAVMRRVRAEASRRDASTISADAALAALQRVQLSARMRRWRAGGWASGVLLALATFAFGPAAAATTAPDAAQTLALLAAAATSAWVLATHALRQR